LLLLLAVETYSHVAPHIFRSSLRISVQSELGPCVCPGSCISVSGVLDNDDTQHTNDARLDVSTTKYHNSNFTLFIT